MNLRYSLLSVCLSVLAVGATFAQEAPIPVFAANNSGFLQNGPGGPDNLVLFTVLPVPEQTVALLLFMSPPTPFTVIGNMSTGQDIDGDGVEDSLGTVSGLEWSTGTPGQGTLIACTLRGKGMGDGNFYQIDPDTGEATLIGESPEDLDFSDLAFNPIDGLMYGLMNDIIVDPESGDVSYGPNSLWVDTDGDLIPDAPFVDGGGNPIIRTAGFCVGTLATLASGLAFDEFGRLYVYDSLAEEVLVQLASPDSGSLAAPCVNPAPVEIRTEFASNELDHGNGLTVVDTKLLIGTDDEFRSAWVSYFEIPEDYFMPPDDPMPEVWAANYFTREFFQNSFFGSISIGDLVGAESDLEDLPFSFPDNLVVNKGVPCKGSSLEALAISDDFRYCLFPQVPEAGGQPIDIEAVYTLPDPTNLTTLGVEIELHSNVTGLAHFVRAFNVQTGEYDVVQFDADLPFSIDGTTDDTITVDLTFLDFPRYVDQTNGTFRIRIQTFPVGLVPFYPWQLRYDQIIAVYDFD